MGEAQECGQEDVWATRVEEEEEQEELEEEEEELVEEVEVAMKKRGTRALRMGSRTNRRAGLWGWWNTALDMAAMGRWVCLPWGTPRRCRLSKRAALWRKPRSAACCGRLCE